MISPSTDNTVGAVFVGCILSAALFGVTIAQTVSYIQNRQADSLFVDCVVIVSLILDIFLTILVSHGVYVLNIKSLDNREIMAFIPWTLRCSIIVTGISVVIVRCFFVRRIWILSKGRVIVTGIQVVFMTVAFVIATLTGIRMIIIKTFEELSASPWLVYSARSTNMAADLSIASTTFYYLCKNSSGFRGTAEIVNSLILFVVGTGVISVVWDILKVCMFATAGETLLFFIFFFSVSKLYVNALLASLNARNVMQKKLEPRSLIFIDESSGHRSGRLPVALPPQELSGDFELAQHSQARASKSEVGSIVSTLSNKAGPAELV